eukprot:11900413-Alexandrium_andersonii.AAC.1
MLLPPVAHDVQQPTVLLVKSAQFGLSRCDGLAAVADSHHGQGQTPSAAASERPRPWHGAHSRATLRGSQSASGGLPVPAG